MAEKKFKLTEKEALDLIWSQIMMENSENFTPEFKSQVLNALREIREPAEDGFQGEDPTGIGAAFAKHGI